ncbi:MAG: histone-lysine N-methyltransferase [Deltaproteobacteria bacterium RBG_16_48_10]|nr:MAG: histone-lysine N-methyltransferase [Deltaproteobacteria bacterium RBG_16_48_10]
MTLTRKKRTFQSKSVEPLPLLDTQEPNLYRSIFPYDEVCRVEFDNKFVFIDPPEEIFITDTTFRDGQQARPPYTVEQIVDLFDMLHKLGGPNGVIRQSEFFLYSEKDKEGAQKCLEKNYRYPEITGWIRAVKEDFKLVKEMGLKETGILTSVSDYHIFLKLRKNRRVVLREYLAIVSAALDLGITPRCHFEDVTRADIYGFCVPFAQDIMRLSEEAKLPVKIRLCDTMGYGVPYSGASLPRCVPKIIRAMIDDAGVPSEYLEWHGHNDFYKGFINATTAWLYGCSAANGTLLGFGERTGNAPIEGLIIEYISLVGHNNGADTTMITEIRNYFERVIGVPIPSNMPFVGANFNATSAGIHADGILKNEEIYNIFNTTKILSRPISISVNDKSGLAGIGQWINSHFALTGKDRIEKIHPGVAKINRWVTKQYEEGRLTSISDQEMEKATRKYLPEIFVSEFDRLKARAHEMAYHIIERVIEEPPMRSMDPTRMEMVLQSLVDDYPYLQYVYVVNIQGKKITRTICQPVDQAKFANVPLGESYLDRPWFINPLKDGKIHVTDLYSSKHTGALCITLSGPIRDERGEIKGVLGLDIRFEDLTKSEEE